MEEQAQCAECGTILQEGLDRQQTDDAVFCRPCFERLTLEVGHAIASQGEEINYPMAFAGGLAGSLFGAIVWWGFTAATGWHLGLVAIVIGYATARGVVRMSGGKRHINLQIMSIALSIAGFAYGRYLVNRSLIIESFAKDGQAVAISLLPNPDVFYAVISAGFRPFDLIFLAIVIYEAWKFPAPVKMAGPS